MATGSESAPVSHQRSGYGCLVVVLLLTAAATHLATLRFTNTSGSQRENLVMYLFAPTDPQFLRNLEVFVKEAVQGDTRSDYVIVVQKSPELNVGCTTYRGMRHDVLHL